MNLKPCPNCKSDRLYPPTKDAVFANCRDCLFVGPRPDPDGKWWNAMVRDGEAPFVTTPPYAPTRRDEFAKAALTTFDLLDPRMEEFARANSKSDIGTLAAELAVGLADAVIARLDATEVRDGTR